MSAPIVPSFLSLALAACCAWGLVPTSASGQSPVEPRLPGAVEKAPSWLKEAPFDVAKFFELPPATQNAGRSTSTLSASSGPSSNRFSRPMFESDRRPSHNARSKLEQYTSNGRMTLARPTGRPFDAILAEYKEGFRKLDLAQRRQSCVFAIGMTIDAPVTHAQVARPAARLLVMRASRGRPG